MKTKHILAIAAIGGMLYYVGTKIAGAVAMTFRRIRWRGFDGGRANFELTYALFNDQNIVLTVEGFKGHLIYGDNYRLAELKLDSPVELLPGDKKELSVNIGVPLLKIGSEILRALDEKTALRRFTVKGILRVTPLNAVTVAIPISTELRLTE